MNRSSLDLDGYGQVTPDPQWPNRAEIAVQVALYLDTTDRETSNPETYEYGLRAGFWRLYRLLVDANIPVTVFGSPATIASLPRQVAAMQAVNWEIALYVAQISERDDVPVQQAIADAMAKHQHITGQAPFGCATQIRSSGTTAFAAAPLTLAYVSHSSADDIPYWVDVTDPPQLVIPEQPRIQYPPNAPFQSAETYYQDLQFSFDALKQEGAKGHPKMMTICLHPGIEGQAARAAALSRFFKHIAQDAGVWFATRAEIAFHWRKAHPAPPPRFHPSSLDGKDFVDTFGQVYPNAPWIAEQAWESDLTPAHDTAEGLHSALFRRFRAATLDQRIAVLHTQPPCLTHQAASHFSFTETESAQVAKLCADYREKHGFPFVLASLDHSKIHLFQLLEDAVANETSLEISRACREIETLARDRLIAIFEQHQPGSCVS